VVPLMRDLEMNGWLQDLGSSGMAFDLIGKGVKRG
jgi:hypothetical protein